MSHMLIFMISDRYILLLFFCTYLIRRRLSAEGAKPESNKRWKTGSGHVCMYVCMYVGFFKDISRSSALNESKVVSCCSPVYSTLHRHVNIRVRFLTVMSIGNNQKFDIGTKKIPIPNRYLVFLFQISWYFIGILSMITLKFGYIFLFYGKIKIGLVFGFCCCHLIGIGLVSVCHFRKVASLVPNERSSCENRKKIVSLLVPSRKCMCILAVLLK